MKRGLVARKVKSGRKALYYLASSGLSCSFGDFLMRIQKFKLKCKLSKLVQLYCKSKEREGLKESLLARLNLSTRIVNCARPSQIQIFFLCERKSERIPRLLSFTLL